METKIRELQQLQANLDEMVAKLKGGEALFEQYKLKTAALF